VGYKRVAYFDSDWAKNDEEEKDRTFDDLMSALVFFLLIIVVALLMLYTPENAGGQSVSSWPAGTPLRFEARRDFNLQGGYLSSGSCLEVDGERLGDRKHFVESKGRRKIKSEFEHVYRNRPFECSSADHDLYVRYVDQNGTVFDVISHSSVNSAEGAFVNSTPTAESSGKVPYRDHIQTQMFRTEEYTYRHRYMKPGTYYFNVHLASADYYTPNWDVKLGVYLIFAEGTEQEQVVFADFITLNGEDGNREKTVASFQVGQDGNIIPDSIDYETQVAIMEKGQ
jgi:hypothetical protein